MALRAGYYGLKNSVKKTLEKLAIDMVGAKIIKSVGAGLSLSDAGALTADIKSVGAGLDLSEAGALTSDIKTIGEGLSLSEEGELSATSSGGGPNYSGTEQKVGSWFGADLYEKTISVGQMPNNTTKEVQHSISNLDKVVYISGVAIDGYNHASRQLQCLYTGAMADWSVDVEVTRSVIRMASKGSYSSMPDTVGYVTLRYTKTSA